MEKMYWIKKVKKREGNKNEKTKKINEKRVDTKDRIKKLTTSKTSEKFTNWEGVKNQTVQGRKLKKKEADKNKTDRKIARKFRGSWCTHATLTSVRMYRRRKGWT